MPKGLNQIQKRLLTIGILAVALYLLGIFEDHPEAVEKYYSEGLYILLCKVFHPLFNIIPFSLGDVIYIAVVAYLIYCFVRLISLVFKRRFNQAGNLVLGLVIGIQMGLLIFYLFWGLNYFRPSMGERLGLRDTSYTAQRLYDVTCMIIDSANTTRARLTAADTLQDNQTIYETAIKAVNKMSAKSPGFRAYHPHIKPSLLTPLMNYLSTSGYYNPFTSEAQMNYQMPYFERPFVACHEMSHQIGYGFEDEASFSGFLIGVNSSDRLLRYSAYQDALDECMHALRRRDTAISNELKTHISKIVRADLHAQRVYWQHYRGQISLISGMFYDDYLKANNQPHGMDTYNQMVLLLMTWYSKH
ncbi:DUF3810 domain-containing protein [Mucilaginibacter panaciglaebae]|uniref:DUF3810 domain-containing protein n=1 Tax=Mucilaginibacter panaciglaebae TaxID=502331 RepID=A0ABP7WH59_9SPHI